MFDTTIGFEELPGEDDVAEALDVYDFEKNESYSDAIPSGDVTHVAYDRSADGQNMIRAFYVEETDPEVDRMEDYEGSLTFNTFGQRTDADEERQVRIAGEVADDLNGDLLE